MISATIAIEDKSFYENPGFDIRGIVRSLWITMQGAHADKFCAPTASADEGEAGVRWHPTHQKTQTPRVRTSLLGITRLEEGVPHDDTHLRVAGPTYCG